MRKNHWRAVVVASVLMMAVSAFLALAADKPAKPAAEGKVAGQPMPGCSMHGGAGTGMDAGMSGCGMKAGAKGCCMHGDMKGCCKQGDMKDCCKHGGMKGCCRQGDMKGCGKQGDMKGCGMKSGAGEGLGGGMMCGPGMGPHPGAGCGMMALHVLDLTADQQKKVAAVHERQQRQMIQKQADLRLAMMDLRGLMHAEKPEQAKINAQIDKLAGLRTGMAKARVAALLEVRGMLTPEQLEKWQAIPMEGFGEEDV